MTVVILDAFGTICEIGDLRRPFGRLAKWLRDNGCAPDPDMARWLMTRPLDLRSACASAAVPENFLVELESDLTIELASIRLFPDTIAALHELHAAGVRIALCSNLAAPYAAPVRALLPFELAHYGWSFEIGAIKPDPAIYQEMCDALGCSPSEVLFVGHTEDADVEGPRKFGMRAVHLDRERTGHVKGRIIRSLCEVANFIAA
jgi:HAD superfamily hydrolase (TIGR01509 family)